ncbi:17653_t:CDS:2, partial [Rhizophagus irregularis]
MEICLDNPQKAIIQKQKCPKIITITQHNALVLPIFIQLSTEQNTLKQELTNIRHQLKSLKNIEYYTDRSLANRIISNNDLSHITDNITVDLGAAFYTNNELGEFSVYLCLSLWPSSTRVEIVAIFLALLTAPENSNGHSGITGNDIADKLAKKGQCENNLFRNNVDFINNILSYFPVFIDNPIEINIRRFILKILAI